jgi:hypothetical protein
MDVENVSNGSVLEAPSGNFGQSLKKVQAVRRAGWAPVERVPKTASQDRHFLPSFHRYRDYNFGRF